MASLSKKLQVVVNGRPQEVEEGALLGSLLAELKVATKGVAVEVNEQIVPKSQQQTLPLSDGDRIEVVSFVGGG